jgi:hypothetical protein
MHSTYRAWLIGMVCQGCFQYMGERVERVDAAVN